MISKFKAVWTSPSSINDFLSCSRSYFLKNVYKTPEKRKISIVSPATSMGTVVHQVLESFTALPIEERRKTLFSTTFYKFWQKVSGEVGGFSNQEEEDLWKEKGINILRNVRENIEVIMGETVSLLPDPTELPWMWLSEKDEIILCGSIDNIFDGDYYKVIDYKTGAHREKETSVQLPVYKILLSHFLTEKPVRSFYWYLGLDSEPVEKELPDLKESKDKILEIALQMKEARLKGEWSCPHGGCWNCRPLDRILKGEGKKVGFGSFGAECYKLDK